MEYFLSHFYEDDFKVIWPPSGKVFHSSEPVRKNLHPSTNEESLQFVHTCIQTLEMKDRHLFSNGMCVWCLIILLGSY